ncbi:MAG: DNA N-6-adenine-methyltransferase [Desulfovibrionaceae bacterium]
MIQTGDTLTAYTPPQKGCPFDVRQTHGKDEWLTPPEIIRALGPFDLDPCAPVARPWDTARLHYTIQDNGLSRTWTGRVWLNPPYGRDVVLWIRRMDRHNNGCALVFARTDTAWFQKNIFHGNALAVFFLAGRLNFHHVDGRRSSHNGGAPSCLIAWGKGNVSSVERSGLEGAMVRIDPMAERRIHAGDMREVG